MINLQGLTLLELEEFFERIGEPKYRGRQLSAWIYKQGTADFSKMTDFPKGLREKLKAKANISRLEIIGKQVSKLDKTVKYLLRTADNNLMETVFIPGKKRNTVCISTQVGCSLKCTFCLTGGTGFKRNLNAAEIVGQIITVVRDMVKVKRISNVVFMGMGEPLLNYDNVIKAVKIINAAWGLGIGARKVTISTAGIVPEIYRLSNEDLQIRLAISLNAATNEKRSQIMPLNQKYPLEKLIKAAEFFSKSANRYLTFEYTLIADFNESREDALQLAGLLKDIPCKINLIAYNESSYKRYKTPSKQAIIQFKNILTPSFPAVTLRKSSGADILAACGQLRGKL